MQFRPHAAIFLMLTTIVLRGDPAFDAAMALVQEHRFPEATEALERVVTTSPANASAWHQLGLVWSARQGNGAAEAAVKCFTKAIELEPKNPTFLADYGGASLTLAQRTRSLSAATKGREALLQAITLNPDLLEAREALYQYYAQAPFFAGGSASKAAAQLEGIRQRDPDRAMVLEVVAKTNAKQYADAFKLCEAALQRKPDSYTALYQYGRLASVSGQNLERGLECLQKVLQHEPPGPNSPKPTHAWYRIGDIQRKLGHEAEATAAFQEALKLDPSNQQASAALAKAK